MDKGHKKDKKGTEKERSAMIRFLEHGVVAAIITTVVIGALGFFWSSYTGFRELALARYDSLRNNIERLTFTDEEIYIFCQHFEEFSNPQGSLANTQMFKFRDVIIDQFEKIFDDVRTLEFISYKGYYKVYQLACWHDMITSSPNGICKSGLLLSSAEMFKWRAYVLEEIAKERKQISQNPMYSLRYYFVEIFKGSGRELPYHVECEKNPIPPFVRTKV